MLRTFLVCIFSILCFPTLTQPSTTFQENLYFYEGDTYLDLDIIFNREVVVFAIVDDFHYLPLNEQQKEPLVLEVFYKGSVHDVGRCKIRVTLVKEQFLICTNKECYTLTVNRPPSGNYKAKYKYRYKDMTVEWSDSLDVLVDAETQTELK